MVFFNKSKKQHLERRQKTWFDTQWKHAMAWLYGFICFFDFFLAPVYWPIILHADKQTVVQWAPITLQGGGLFHVAMASVLGITAWWNGARGGYNPNEYQGNYRQPYQEPYRINNRSVPLPDTDNEDADQTRKPYVDPEKRM